MNAGQHLVALSGLPSGSAVAHLLAIQAGAGTGQTVFASQFAVAIETPSIELSRKVRPVQGEAVQHQPAISRSKDLKAMYCAVGMASQTAGVSTDEMTVRIGHQTTLFVHKAERAEYVKKGLK